MVKLSKHSGIFDKFIIFILIGSVWHKWGWETSNFSHVYLVFLERPSVHTKANGFLLWDVYRQLPIGNTLSQCFLISLMHIQEGADPDSNLVALLGNLLEIPLKCHFFFFLVQKLLIWAYILFFFFLLLFPPPWNYKLFCKAWSTSRPFFLSI